MLKTTWFGTVRSGTWYGATVSENSIPSITNGMQHEKGALPSLQVSYPYRSAPGLGSRGLGWLPVSKCVFQIWFQFSFGRNWSHILGDLSWVHCSTRAPCHRSLQILGNYWLIFWPFLCIILNSIIYKVSGVIGEGQRFFWESLLPTVPKNPCSEVFFALLFLFEREIRASNN